MLRIICLFAFLFPSYASAHHTYWTFLNPSSNTDCFKLFDPYKKRIKSRAGDDILCPGEIWGGVSVLSRQDEEMNLIYVYKENGDEFLTKEISGIRHESENVWIIEVKKLPHASRYREAEPQEEKPKRSTHIYNHSIPRPRPQPRPSRVRIQGKRYMEGNAQFILGPCNIKFKVVLDAYGYEDYVPLDVPSKEDLIGSYRGWAQCEILLNNLGYPLRFKYEERRVPRRGRRY